MVPGGEVTRRILTAYEAGELITRCAWCGRIQLDDQWLLTPPAAFTAIQALYTVSDSICPPCVGALAAPPVGAG